MLYWANDLEQSQVAPGATVLGTILSSDKTNISVMTGGHVALADFCYLAQAPEITKETCIKIDAALMEFHQNKDVIILAGA